MYKVEKKKYGIHVVLSGFIEHAEIIAWGAEVERMLGTLAPKFGVFVDMRELKPLPVESQEEMGRIQVLVKAKGVQRSVTIANNPITRMQFMRLGKESGVYEYERYIDASATKNWEGVGLNWITDAVDPDK